MKYPSKKTLMRGQFLGYQAYGRVKVGTQVKTGNFWAIYQFYLILLGAFSFYIHCDFFPLFPLQRQFIIWIFQIWYSTLLWLKGLKSNVCFTKEIYSFKLRRLETFELLELKQSYIAFLKVLMCGNNVFGA